VRNKPPPHTSPAVLFQSRERTPETTGPAAHGPTDSAARGPNPINGKTVSHKPSKKDPTTQGEPLQQPDINSTGHGDLHRPARAGSTKQQTDRP
jgi:hypothetical protein